MYARVLPTTTHRSLRFLVAHWSERVTRVHNVESSIPICGSEFCKKLALVEEQTKTFLSPSWSSSGLFISFGRSWRVQQPRYAVINLMIGGRFEIKRGR